MWGEVKGSDLELTEFNDWWTNEHLPERLSIRGFQRARRYNGKHRSISRQHYLTLYEVGSLATLTSNSYMARLNNPTAGTKKHLPTLAWMDRAACIVLAYCVRSELRGCGGVLAGNTLVLEANILPEDQVVSAVTNLSKKWFDGVSAIDKAMVSCVLLLENEEATAPGSASQSYQDVVFSKGKGDGSVRLIWVIESTGAVGQYEEALDGVFEVADCKPVWPHRTKSLEYQLMCSISG